MLSSLTYFVKSYFGKLWKLCIDLQVFVVFEGFNKNHGVVNFYIPQGAAATL